MSHPEVAGVDLRTLQAPMHDALIRYEEESEGHFAFDTENAVVLKPAGDKPYAAFSETPATYLGEPVGKLVVVAFQPFGATGSEADYKFRDLQVVGRYPRSLGAAIVPRKKTGIKSEVHMALVSQAIDDTNADPVLFGGTCDLLGLDHHTIRKIGMLGRRATNGRVKVGPVATLTTGRMLVKGESVRFGDPHAVINAHEDQVVVGAFFAQDDALAAQFPHMVHWLNPQLPMDKAA